MKLKKMIILMISLLTGILVFIGDAQAGWASSIIRVCDQTGNCYIANIYAWVNSGKFCL